MSENEWHGEPHTLIVHAVEPLSGDEDPGYREFEYDLEHPPSCKQERSGDGGNSYLYWTCDVAFHEVSSGLASSLAYSGTPITEPGTYRIQVWGRKTYYHGSGYEYDGGVGVMEPAEVTP